MSVKAKNVKIILIGDSRVGKTTLRHRYMGEGFQRTYSATLGVDISVKKVQDRTIMIYDLAGDPSSKMLRQQYYMSTDGILMVFDITDRTSFENLSGWLDEIKEELQTNMKIFILGNKDDLREGADDPVSEEEAYQFTKQVDQKFASSISYLSTSALTGYNVEVAFNKLVSEILHGR